MPFTDSCRFLDDKWCAQRVAQLWTERLPDNAFSLAGQGPTATVLGNLLPIVLDMRRPGTRPPWGWLVISPSILVGQMLVQEPLERSYVPEQDKVAVAVGETGTARHDLGRQRLADSPRVGLGNANGFFPAGGLDGDDGVILADGMLGKDLKFYSIFLAFSGRLGSHRAWIAVSSNRARG